MDCGRDLEGASSDQVALQRKDRKQIPERLVHGHAAALMFWNFLNGDRVHPVSQHAPRGLHKGCLGICGWKGKGQPGTFSLGLTVLGSARGRLKV